MALASFSPRAREWFARELGAPTPVQVRGWDAIARGEHTLMCAPTGSGKTLAAFFHAIDRLSAVGTAHNLTESEGRLSREPAPGTRVVYVSPIKALAYDIEKNLRAPLAGIGASITVDVRTGDTPAKERERQRKDPGQILVTTPESLYLVLAGRARERLRTVDTVIIDEIHALAGGKRGVHLALTLERLAHLAGRDPQRIGLSATQRPLTEVARYLGGDRAVEIVDASTAPALDLQIVVPAADMEAAGRDAGIWPHVYPRLLDEILAHRQTIVFVNSRRLAERVAEQIGELAVARGVVQAGAELIRAHHGSIARGQRLEIEEGLKSGRLRAITATSSLELGIDIGAVDLVLQVESPGSVARGLQRIGRAGHHVGGTSVGRIFPKFRGDLLEATVVAKEMRAGHIEAVRVPDAALDVLAQQIVAMVGVEPWSVPDLERLVRRAASYRDVPREALVGVLDMLDGRYPSDRFAELRPRLTWDRRTDTLVGRRGAKLLSIVSGGTIPDRGLYGVHLGPTGPRVGELDEEMVAESRKGETFVLGATTWRIEDITRDRVIVSPAPGEPGKLPFWRADGPGRPVELGRALGAFCRELDARQDPQWLESDYGLDANAAANLCRYLADQRAHAGTVPTDRTIVIERFRDELGDPRACILTPFGSRVHAPWSLVLARKLEDRLGYPVHPLYTDDGIAMRFSDGDALPNDADLIPDPAEVERVLVDELARSSLFASHFRENAARALLLPRRRPGQRTPLWAQRLRAQQLMSVALEFPSFPITLETYREVLRDVFDVPALLEILRGIGSGEIHVEPAATQSASPFARSLVFDYVAAFLYEGDAPIAERKAQALTLDRDLLRELVGGGELRELLDADVISEVESELQGVAEGRRARDIDELIDQLRRIGDLRPAEIAAHVGVGVGVGVSVGVSDLIASGRAAQIGDRIVAIEDVPRYESLTPTLTPTPTLTGLVERYARTHGPFTTEQVAHRFGVMAAQIEPILDALETRGQLVRGELRPGGTAKDSCDPEVLRQLRRRTLAKLRAAVAPVPAATYAEFLPRWHNLDMPRRGVHALRDAIVRLEGLALPIVELESRILPARVLDYHPHMLDELGATGELAWIGASDKRVILVRRDRARALAPEAQPPIGDIHAAVLHHLARAGASFLVAIEQGIAAPRTEVTAALWDLVWAGAITNDTFAPLRSLHAPKRRRTSPHASMGGRWSLVASLGVEPTATARMHAQATALLDRWGIASRAGARADDIPGGFAAVGDVLRAMEDAGTVRRGFFVESLEGAQFAWPAAVDRLRAPPRGAPRVDTISAIDPACAWGTALPWPTLRHPDTRPARRAGASVVQVGGVFALWVEPKAKKITTAIDVAASTIELALAVGIPQLAARSRRRELLVETIDGEPAARSPYCRTLTNVRIDYRGLVVPAAQVEHSQGIAPSR